MILMETNLNSYLKPHLASTASLRGSTVLDSRVKHTGSNPHIAFFDSPHFKLSIEVSVPPKNFKSSTQQ